jgi:hypothetical protein
MLEFICGASELQLELELPSHVDAMNRSNSIRKGGAATTFEVKVINLHKFFT